MKDILNKILLACLLILIVVETGLYLARFYMGLSCDLPIDYEGPTFWGVRLLASGGNIYDPSTLNSAPYMVTIYMPLYYAIASLLQHQGDLYTGLKMCRVLSVISVLIAAWLSYRIFILSGIERIRAYVGVFVFLNFFALWIWSTYCRVDLLATALSLFALERFLTVSKTDGKELRIKALIVPMIICIASVFTKQSSFVIAFSIAVYFLWHKNWKMFAWWSLAFGAGCTAIAAICQAITGGGFLLHMRFASKMPFDWNMMMDHLGWIGLDWLKILVIAASCLVLIIFGARIKKDQFLSLSIPFLISTALFTLYTLGTQFPNTNHAILFYFVLCWFFLQISNEFRHKRTHKQEGVYSISLLSASMVSCALMSTLTPSMLACPSELSKARVQLETMPKLAPESLVFTEDPFISLVSSTKPLFVDVSTFVQVWRGARGDDWDRELKDMVSNKKFAAVLLNCHDDLKEKPIYYWNEKLVDVIHQKYSLNSALTGNRQIHNFYLPSK